MSKPYINPDPARQMKTMGAFNLSYIKNFEAMHRNAKTWHRAVRCPQFTVALSSRYAGTVNQDYILMNRHFITVARRSRAYPLDKC